MMPPTGYYGIEHTSHKQGGDGKGTGDDECGNHGDLIWIERMNTIRDDARKGVRDSRLEQGNFQC